MEGGKQGGSIKKVKKDKAVGAAGKPTRPETNTIAMAPRVKPELALPTMYSLEALRLYLLHLSPSLPKIWQLLKLFWISNAKWNLLSFVIF